MQVSATEAAARLQELVDAANDGEEVIICIDNRPAIKLVPIESIEPRPKFGSAKGLIWMSDDFDEPLEKFREYME
ncbi:type II toxin-antitoxin system prevent-host-death family antitoxin [Chamaesiphon sp. OTE_75_metabat_556]|uniref:type II toxin-antitoxin system Phd/YefM family antitoxin n=1 Tax=Chamaesiphon sp. OTE_75_metabat_556 TaxID=2964692 RepID=UPI00286BA1DD|nr:type II toxin-antitoxin system prevent-host-death family antitoxin [Chamaesiphon sp. OTE_75_metabat_556]